MSDNMIELGNGYRIVAESYGDGIHKELNICLYDESGSICQDICTVRPHNKDWAHDDKDDVDTDVIDCIVWANEYDENYTDRFVIGIYRDEP